MDAFDFTASPIDQAQSWLTSHGVRLSFEEATTLQTQILKRAPTLTECLLWSIQGSEHCAYKSSKSYLKTLPTKAPQLLLGVGEDAGVVAVATDDCGKRFGIAISHESHNHPSQKVPFEGAATGVGGNVRDVNCMGARVIASADSLRFGDCKATVSVWQASGAIAGIASYGNAIGVPNIAGDIAFHPAYGQQCLVTVTSIGVVAEDSIIHSYAPANAVGYQLILIGKATDNSGFGGASFASNTIEARHKHRGAVQEPNAFLKQHLLKANQAMFDILAQDKLLSKVAFKDLGAGGIACASVEMADQAGFGCELDLDAVPLGIPGLDPSVILLSETQERFLWAVPTDLVETILQHYNQRFMLPALSPNAAATVIGQITASPYFVVKHGQQTLVEALASDVTRGIEVDRPVATPDIPVRNPLSLHSSFPSPYAVLRTLLANPAIANQHPVFSRYDKQVQGRTVLERGGGAAGVLAPFFDDATYSSTIANTGVALAVSHSPWLAVADSYHCAMHAVLHSAQSVACVGAMPLAITDCLCFGNPEHPSHMHDFVEGVKGVHDACHGLAGLSNEHPLPVVAGNVSFYNAEGEQTIPPSPLISCLGQMPDAFVAVGCQLISEEAQIWWLGEPTWQGLGGSVFANSMAWPDLTLPQWHWQALRAQIVAIITAIRAGEVLSAMPVGLGGLLTTVVRMALPNRTGVLLEHPVLTDVNNLFGEAPGLVLQLTDDASQKAAKIFDQHGLTYHCIGRTTMSNTFCLHPHPAITLNELLEPWNSGLECRLW